MISEMTKEEKEQIVLRRNVIIMVVGAFEKESKGKTPLSIPTMHYAIEQLQGVLQKKGGRSTNYEFSKDVMDRPWSEQLQMDIDGHDAFGIDITVNYDLPIRDMIPKRGYVSLVKGGRFMLDSTLLRYEMVGLMGKEGFKQLQKDINEIVKESMPFTVLRT